jgi:hypothetical protein
MAAVYPTESMATRISKIESTVDAVAGLAGKVASGGRLDLAKALDRGVSITITGFTPASGPVGTSVNLTGSGFTDATKVAFHGTAAATFSVDSDTQITAPVPSGATTGTIAVTTPGGTVASATSFTVVPAPIITKLKQWVVTLNLSDSQIKVNDSVTYSGAVQTASGSPGAGAVTLQKRPATGGDWTAWKTATLKSNGSYSLAVKMSSVQVSQVRARMSGNTANATGFSANKKITVNVLPKWQVTIKASPTLVKTNQTITYLGTVKTASGRAGSGTVTIQKRPASGGSWTNWKTATLKANGSYSLPVKMTAAQVSQVRARKAANSVNATGFSANKKITVNALSNSSASSVTTTSTSAGLSVPAGSP